MKQGWTYKKLGEVYPIVMGKTPPRNIAKYWDPKKQNQNLWVSIADLTKNEGGEIKDTKEYISDEGASNIKLVQKGSLLVSFKLTLGKMAFAGKDLYTNEAIMSLPPKKDLDLRFLYYYFSSLDWGKMTSGNEKIKGKTLNKKSLAEIPVAILSPSDQQRIVSRLDSAFAHIDELKANAEKQLSEAKTLFQKALEKAMEPKEGWEEKTLKDVVLSITDGDHQPPPKSPNGIPFITISDINKESYQIDFGDTFFVPKDYYEKVQESRKPQKGDLLYTVTGSFGIPVIVECDREFCFQRHIALIKPNHEILVTKFLFYWVLSDYSMSQAEDTATGAAQRTVSLTSLRKFIISIPSISEQQRIVERLDSLSANIQKLEEIQRKTIAECDALKQALLRKVFE